MRNLCAITTLDEIEHIINMADTRYKIQVTRQMTNE